MGLALGAGLAAAPAPRARLVISDRNAEKRARAEDLGVSATDDNEALARESDVLILAVKPQHLKALCATLAPALERARPLLISVAAGIRVEDLDAWLGGGQWIVRAMPNTPALLRAGTSVLYAGAGVPARERALAETLLATVSRVFWVPEEALMDAATAVSGSGPAYLFLFLEALIAAGAKAGLPPALAADLARSTTLGAARMAEGGDVDVATLRARVTSPGGTTERAIASLLADDFPGMMARAVAAACARSRQLSAEWGAS